MYTKLYVLFTRIIRAMTVQPERSHKLGFTLVTVAKCELGRGEYGGNNMGPDVVKYRGGIGGKGSWCAAFVGWCIERACLLCGVESLFVTPRSMGAKALFRQLVKQGKLVKVNDVKSGDIVCVHRGTTKDTAWQGHIFIVESVDPQVTGLIRTIEGNVGSYPSVVKRFSRDLKTERVVGIVRLGQVKVSIPLLETQTQPSQG